MQATMELDYIFEEDEESETEACVEAVMNELIDELSLGLSFDVHRACKMGIFLLDETDGIRPQYEIVNQIGFDVFGQVPTKKQYECVCPNCQRSLAASRFAPHLEKCMGMGRNSSRLASRRGAARGAAMKKDSDNESEGDNDNDNDWSYPTDRRVKKIKRDKNNGSPRRSKLLKGKNGNGDVNLPSGIDLINLSYENITGEERRMVLQQICGVVSEHSKKVCTRPLKCKQHSDEQRKTVRILILGASGSLEACEDVIDIDTYEDGDSQVLRDTLQWEAISNPSPADSTSTTTSTGSKRKRIKHSKLKKGSTSKHGHSNTATPSNTYDFV